MLAPGTPGDALYTTMYSDGPDDCDPTGDDRTSAELTYVEGADASVNLYPLCHWEVHKDPVALAWILKALQGLIGSN